MSFRHGIEELGKGVYAYLQPDGSWGLNNVGLVDSSDGSLLVDTMFDLAHTRRMLDAFRRLSQAPIQTVVNTHANGDHCWGNELVSGAEIVASRASAEEMQDLPPKRVAMLQRVARVLQKSGWVGQRIASAAGRRGFPMLEHLVTAAPFVERAFGGFRFDGITLTPPTRIFDKELRLDVGDQRVELLEVGPAHTRGDVIVRLPSSDVVFTGDILFIESHPIVWAGPFQNWIDACQTIIEWSPQAIVPGHGPLTDTGGVKKVADYLVYIRDEAKARFDAGVDATQAAIDIAKGAFTTWGERERVAVNVETVYRELDPSRPEVEVVELFARMARVAAAL